VCRDYPTCGRNGYTSPPPRVRVPRHVARLLTQLIVTLIFDYFTSVARLGASARRAARRRLLRLAQARRRQLRLAQARRRLLHLRRASGCLGTSRGSSRDSSRHSSSTIRLRRASGCLGTSRGSSGGSSRRSSLTSPPRAGSSSTTSPPPRVRVPRHVARLVTRLVVPLIVDYSASRKLVVDYFAYATRTGASARRAARLVAHCAARRRLLRLRHASGCLITSCGLSRDSSSTTSPHAGSSSTTLPTSRVRVPRHVARLVTWLVVDYFASRWLVVDYFAYAVRPGASACRAARHPDRRRLLRLRRAFAPSASARRAARHMAHRRLLRAP
jgi:hypothetical protein